MDEAYPHRSLPPVVLPAQAVWIKYFDQLTVVLSKPSCGRRHSSGHVEGLGDKRREPLHQHARNERDEHEIHLCVEGSDSRPKRLMVEPRRIFHILEEIAQTLGGITQKFVLMLQARSEEAMQVICGERGDILHHRIQHGITYSSVPDIVVGGLPIDGARLGVAVGICRWDVRYRRRNICHVDLSNPSHGGSGTGPDRMFPTTIRRYSSITDGRNIVLHDRLIVAPSRRQRAVYLPCVPPLGEPRSRLVPLLTDGAERWTNGPGITTVDLNPVPGKKISIHTCASCRLRD